MDVVLQLWGKTGQEDTFHPAVFHMLDAGHVAARLLGRKGPARFRNVLARALGVQEPDRLAEWLPLVVALHDVGKISTAFQKQSDEQYQRLLASGVPFSSRRALPEARHHHVSAVALRDEILSALLPALVPIEQLLIDVHGGHHGRFTALGDLKPARLLISGEGAEWRTFRRDAVTYLLQAFPFPTNFNVPTIPNLRAATLALTGFVILCDWLASNTEFFPVTAGISVDDYIPTSRQRAIKAVATAGFDDQRSPVVWSGFSTIFPEIKHPHPLQEDVDQLPLASTFEPTLTIIEAPTGEGKTETALALSRRLAASGASDEMYVALPTMATSNQMYGRVMEFLRRTNDSNTAPKLIHGQAFLVEDDLNLQFTGDNSDTGSPAAAAPQWFAPKKRALLAPFGVGTVDQAELAVLSTRHYMLRLFGLAGKVVIIDEVHAYDTYMSTIIDHALTWLAALGSPVILLSATLPASRHREMAAAYQRGLPGYHEEQNNATPRDPLPYPVIASYTSRGRHISTPAASQPARALHVRMTPERSPAEEARYLLETIRGGGAVCRITNTVNRAQETYAALRDIAPETIELHLIHARLPLDDRLAREDILADRLGPHSKRTSSEQIIVVGTQVLEQSLDYDVDRMISDLAPIDLLLQRAGRLHRHLQRTDARPVHLQLPVLEVGTGRVDDGLPDLGSNDAIYDAMILLQSWLTLQQRSTNDGVIHLTLPEDYRSLIEQVYGGPSLALPLDHPGHERFQAAVESWHRTRQEMRDSAMTRLVPDVTAPWAITEEASLHFEEEDDEKQPGWGTASTRYGERSISLVPLHRVPDGVALEPDGMPINPRIVDRETQLRLLRRGIRVSHQTLVNHLPGRFTADLPGWSNAALLRGYHPLILEEGEWQIHRLRVRLSPDLGLEYLDTKGDDA